MEIREHAILYGLIAKRCLERLPADEGKTLIRQITVSYGRKRGARMRRKADENNEAADLTAYLAYGEWRGKAEENLSTLSYEPVRTVSTVTKCAWHDTWKEYGLLEYGRYYCRYIDQALCEGFDGSFSLEIPASMGHGDDHCTFVWSQAADEKEAALKKERLGEERFLPFDFHCQELLECAAAVLEEHRYSGILNDLEDEFKKLTGVSLK